MASCSGVILSSSSTALSEDMTSVVILTGNIHCATEVVVHIVSYKPVKLFFHFLFAYLVLS